MNTFDVSLDLDKQSTTMQVVRIRQADHDGTTIRATVYDHGEPLALTGAEKRVEFKMRLPDGTHYYATEATIVTASPAVLQVTVNEREAASAVGRTCNAYFSITPSSSNAYSTGSFAVIVEPSAVVDASAAETYDSYVEQAIANANEAADAAWEAAQQTIPDNSVTTQKIVDGAVTADKLGLDVITQMVSQSGASFAKISAAGGYIYVPQTDANGIIDIDDIPMTPLTDAEIDAITQ